MYRHMRVFRSVCPLGLLLAIVCVSVPAAQAPALSASDRKLLDKFTADAKRYMDTEHSLAADKMKPTSDVAKLERQRMLLRNAVQQSRPSAKQGDLFNPETGTVFRKLLAELLNGPGGMKIKASLNHAEPGAPAQFKVNGEFPNQNGQPVQSVPPTVLQVLPPLPKGLEYCIAGNSLALHDSTANIVVDFLPNALPEK